MKYVNRRKSFVSTNAAWNVSWRVYGLCDMDVGRPIKPSLCRYQRI